MSRELFEAWHAEKFGWVNGETWEETGAYTDVAMQLCWEGWQAALAAKPDSPAGEFTDTQRIDHIEAWSAQNKARGFHWNTFSFDVKTTVRDQLDEGIRAAKSAIATTVKDGSDHG